MAKNIVSRDEYIILLNKELLKHPLFEEGMGFRPAVNGNGFAMSSIEWIGAEGRTNIFASIIEKVAAKHEPVGQ